MSSEQLKTEEFQEALVDALMIARQYMPEREEVSPESFAENTETVLGDISTVDDLLNSIQPKYRIIATNAVSGSIAEMAYTRKHRDSIVKGLEDYGFENIEIKKL